MKENTLKKGNGEVTGLFTPDMIPSARVAPHSREAEQALLGALLLNNQAYEKVSDFLRGDHFADGVHGRIYKAIQTLVDRGQIADPITLKGYFDQDNDLDSVEGGEYLATLAGSVITVINTEEYGRIIYDLYLRRQLIVLGEDMVNDAHQYDLNCAATGQIESAEQKLFDLATTGQSQRSFYSFATALTQAIETARIAFKRDSHVVGVTTGLLDMDRWLGGLHPSDLVILAGRPSMGKTALATNIAFNAANSQQSGGRVAFFSLEMSAEQLAMRLLAQESGVPSDRIRRGEISQDDFPTFVDVSRRLQNLPLFIDDTPGLSVSALRTRARRLKRQGGLDLIVIDYLQLLQGGESSRRQENRVQEISEITRSLKGLAKELNVPVVALSQLSRAVEQRDDKRPQLADLRESGSIEQDADVVMFVFREEYYESRREPAEGTEKHREWQQRMADVYNVAEVIIAKQRHGPVGTVRLFYEGRLTKFGNLTHA
jgi:replicative DNA helicase